MYVLTITENNTLKYFSMLSFNGIYTDADIHKAIIFTTSTLANNQKTILNTIDTTKTFTVKQITLTDLN